MWSESLIEDYKALLSPHLSNDYYQYLFWKL